MRPTATKTSWLVWTDDRAYGIGIQTRTTWRWVAHGPLGSDSGVAETADEAVQRAAGAAMVASAPQETRA